MSVNGPETVIAVDPGRAKCGVAVISSPPLTRLAAIVVETDRLVTEISRLLRTYPQVSKLLMGDGTGSSPLRRAVAAEFPEISLTVVDETNSSERARRRYLAEVPPRGWLKLLPRGFRCPDQPYDHFVAILLAEDYFSRISGIEPPD